MCFSATASFAASAVLVSTGAVATKVNTNPRNKMFAGIPFIFGAQQAAEGVVWMTLQHQEWASLHRVAVIAFLFFALALWPAWVPISVFKTEKRTKRRTTLGLLAVAGVFFAVCAVYVLATGEPRSEIAGQCLNYSFNNDMSSFFPPNLHALIYFSATVIPFYVSSERWVKTAGTLILGGLLITLAYWKYAVTSVWCFFGALASLYICAHVFREEKIFDKYWVHSQKAG